MFYGISQISAGLATVAGIKRKSSVKCAEYAKLYIGAVINITSNPLLRKWILFKLSKLAGA